MDILKEFVENAERDFTILEHPELGFFRNFLDRLGAKIPGHPASNSEIPGHPASNSEIPGHPASDFEIPGHPASDSAPTKDSLVVEGNRNRRVSKRVTIPVEGNRNRRVSKRVTIPETTSRYFLRSKIKVKSDGDSNRTVASVTSEADDPSRISRQAIKYPTSRTPNLRRKKAGAPRSNVRRVCDNSGTTTGPTSQVANPLSEAGPSNETCTGNERPTQAANPLTEVGVANEEERAEDRNADVSDPLGAPDVSDNSGAPDVFDNSARLGQDTGDSEPEEFYLGWEHYGFKSQKAFNKRWLSYKALERWLDPKERCCIMLNPEKFDKFVENVIFTELGVYLVAPEDLDKQFKGFASIEQLEPVMVGPYRILIEVFRSGRPGGERHVAKIDDPARPLSLIQTRCFVPTGQVATMDMSEHLVDGVEHISHMIHYLIPSLSKGDPSSISKGDPSAMGKD